MTFDQKYSGSDGNLYVVTSTGRERLLIECGVTWKRILHALDYNLKGIVGCLLSHEHQDHARAIREVARAGIAVHATEGTLAALQCDKGQRRTNGLNVGRWERLGPFWAFPFAVEHDATEPVGFVIRDESAAGREEWLLYATDTSHITARFDVSFSIIAIECSYDGDRLRQQVQAGKVHEAVARRLLTSHMERHETMRYLAHCCDLSETREIHLIHISGDRLDRNAVRQECQDRLFIETRIVGRRGRGPGADRKTKGCW